MPTRRSALSCGRWLCESISTAQRRRMGRCVLPGTQTSGVLSDDWIHQLAVEVSPVDCLVALSGVTGVEALLVHSSSKSQISTPRRVLHIEYATSKAIATGLELAARDVPAGKRNIGTETASSGFDRTSSALPAVYNHYLPQ